MAYIEVGGEKMTAYPRGIFVSVGPRVARRAAFYGAAWIAGAIVLTGLQVAFFEQSGAAPPRQPTITPPSIKAKAIADDPTVSNDFASEELARNAARRAETIRGYSVYLKDFAAGEHSKEEQARIDNLISFESCNQAVAHAQRTRFNSLLVNSTMTDESSKIVHPYLAKVCTEDFLIALIESSDLPGAKFDWSSVLARFGKAILTSSLKDVDQQIIEWNKQSAVSGELKSARYDDLTMGLLFQFGHDISYRPDNNYIISADKEKEVPQGSKNILEALKLYKEAAVADPNAQIVLGLAYQAGFGERDERERAVSYFRLAERQVSAAGLLVKIARPTTDH